MKNYVLIFSIAALLLQSCSNDLDLIPRDQISNSSFWQTESDALAAEAMLYSQFRATYDYKLVAWGEMRTGTYKRYSTATDIGDLEGFLDQSQLFPANDYANWVQIYRLINDANLVLLNVPDINMDESTRSRVMGAAYFARAFSYLKLAQLWGRAPLIVEPFVSAEGDLEIGQSEPSDLVNQAVMDVEEAVKELPATAGVNFLSKAAANILKAEVYLWRFKRLNGGATDLSTARSAIDAVVDPSKLDTNFANIFDEGAGSSEVIFSIYYDASLETSSGNPTPTGRTETGVVVSRLSILGNNQIAPEDLAFRNNGIPIVLAYPAATVGLNDNFVNNKLNAFPGSATQDVRSSVSWSSFTAMPSGNVYEWGGKYEGVFDVANQSYFHSDDVIIYRQADAILLKAEIEAADNDPAEALQFLNLIANRAYDVTNVYAGLTGEALEDAILDEIIEEFVWEGKSYIAMMRFGEVAERTTLGNDPNAHLLPIATDVMNLNSKLVQNPAYE